MAFTHMRILPQGERRTLAAWTECPNAPFPSWDTAVDEGKSQMRGISNIRQKQSHNPFTEPEAVGIIYDRFSVFLNKTI